LPAKYLHNLKLAVKLCHLSVVALGRLDGLPALKTLEVVDPSVYQFLRPGQYPDTDIVPSDSEAIRIFSLNRSNPDKDLAYCPDKEGRRARSFRIILHMEVVSSRRLQMMTGRIQTLG